MCSSPLSAHCHWSRESHTCSSLADSVVHSPPSTSLPLVWTIEGCWDMKHGWKLTYAQYLYEWIHTHRRVLWCSWCACQIFPHGGSVIFITRLTALDVFEYNYVWSLWQIYFKPLFVLKQVDVFVCFLAVSWSGYTAHILSQQETHRCFKESCIPLHATVLTKKICVFPAVTSPLFMLYAIF